MRKQYLRSLIFLIGVAALGVVARGQAVDQIVVNIPYDFVVGGKTLPAGTYKVNRVTDTNERVLIIRSFENRASAMVVAAQVESTSADKVQVSFEQVGGERFLSKIETANHVFTIPVSHSEILEAAARSHSGPSGTGSASGSN
jgi:hypothetical protein